MSPAWRVTGERQKKKTTCLAEHLKEKEWKDHSEKNAQYINSWQKLDITLGLQTMCHLYVYTNEASHAPSQQVYF